MVALPRRSAWTGIAAGPAMLRAMKRRSASTWTAGRAASRDNGTARVRSRRAMSHPPGDAADRATREVIPEKTGELGKLPEVTRDLGSCDSPEMGPESNPDDKNGP